MLSKRFGNWSKRSGRSGLREIIWKYFEELLKRKIHPFEMDLQRTLKLGSKSAKKWSKLANKWSKMKKKMVKISKKWSKIAKKKMVIIDKKWSKLTKNGQK